jgi:hypothetical protein
MSWQKFTVRDLRDIPIFTRKRSALVRLILAGIVVTVGAAAAETGPPDVKFLNGIMQIVNGWVAVADHARTAVIATSCGQRPDEWSTRVFSAVNADLTQRITKLSVSPADLSALALVRSAVLQGQNEARAYSKAACERIKLDGSLAMADAFLTSSGK